MKIKIAILFLLSLAQCATILTQKHVFHSLNFVICRHEARTTQCASIRGMSFCPGSFLSGRSSYTPNLNFFCSFFRSSP